MSTEKRKLLIAESSGELRKVLADMFRGRYLVHCCADGYEAQKLLPRLRPELMVVDVMLPGIDGLSLLQWAQEQGLRPRVLATTRFASDYVMEAAGRLGVGYVMLKPWDLSALAARVEDLSSSLAPAATPGTDPESQVSGLLLALGIQPKLRGFACLREAVLYSAREEHVSVTKVLYPEVARRCGCGAGHVERNIRSAIDAAWAARDENLWRMYFSPDGAGKVPRPTNAAFISRLADSVRSGGAGRSSG